MDDYYDSQDLIDFADICEYSPELWKKYFDFYRAAMNMGTVTEREKALISLAVAVTQKSPFCIEAYTNQCLSLGISQEEMMEAVGAAMEAGVVLAHSTQIRKIIEQKER